MTNLTYKLTVDATDLFFSTKVDLLDAKAGFAAMGLKAKAMLDNAGTAYIYPNAQEALDLYAILGIVLELS